MKMQKNLITPEKASSFIPIFISAGISILIIIFFVMPEYIKSTKVSLELNNLTKKKNDLDDLKSQYKIINQKFEKLNQEKTKIVELVTGKTNLDTLLQKLGEIANRNSVEYESIVPIKIMNYIENNKEKNDVKSSNNDELITDSLLFDGSKKYLIDLNFKAEFNNLLSFLRELEFQENVILISDVDLKLIRQNSNNGEINSPNEKIEVELSTTFYGKL